MAAFGTELSSKRVGAEVLVQIARSKSNGILQWQYGGSLCELVFRQGRPEMAIYKKTQSTTERPRVVGFVRGFANLCQGHYEFIPGKEAAVPQSLKIDTIGEALVSILKSFEAPRLEPVWPVRHLDHLQNTETFERLAATITKLGGPTLPPPDGRSIGQLVEGASIEVQRAWLALIVLSSGHANDDGVESGPPSPKGALPASKAAEPSDDRIPKDPEARRLHFEIKSLHSEIESKTHYSLLGISANADDKAIRKAYFDAVKKWHSDRIATLDLSDNIKKKADEIFHCVEEAYQTLTDAEQRSTYDYLLDRKTKGLPTDPKVIVEAEAIFHKGETLVRRGQAAKAEPLLREALELNKGEADFWVYWGFALYSSKGHDALDEARSAIRKGLKMNNKLDTAHEFLGRIARVEGHFTDAREHFQKALEIQPDNVEATRELRLLSMRESSKQQKPTAGDALGHLLNKVFKR